MPSATFIGRSVTIAGGILLVSLGVLFLVLNLLPLLGLPPIDWGRAWPIFILLVAVFLYVPALLFRAGREILAALHIPGAILALLGLILLYQTLSADWASWAYAWLLIPAAVGLGLATASTVGGWGTGAATVGLVLATVSAALFALFASIFGGPVLQALGPGLFILIGLLLLGRSLLRR